MKIKAFVLISILAGSPALGQRPVDSTDIDQLRISIDLAHQNAANQRKEELRAERSRELASNAGALAVQDAAIKQLNEINKTALALANEQNQKNQSLQARVTELEKENYTLKVKLSALELTQTLSDDEIEHLSNHRVLAHFPAARDPEHQIHSLADSIAEQMQVVGNPILQSPDAAWKIYQIAASELGIPSVLE